MGNTAQVLYKLMSGLYKDVVDGLVKDYVVKEYPTGPLVVHVLLDNDVYWKDGPNGYGGWFNFNNMKEKIENLMRYVNLELVDVKVVPYFDNSKEDLETWDILLKSLSDESNS